MLNLIKENKNILITGGCGFIGSSLVRDYVNKKYNVCNLDNLTYANNFKFLEDLKKNKNYKFLKGSINDKNLVSNLFQSFEPDIIINLAAETHVDRSIESPTEFLETNVCGTFNLLEEALLYWSKLNKSKKKKFRFHHLSTDEVYGSLSENEFFTEKSQYNPSSPYSASKAASDHFVNAYFKTYGLPITISNCSNNYGPFQFPEKLIPLIIFKALKNEKLPVYGDGSNVRDWLFVEDHVKALQIIVEKGIVGENYIVGGDNQKSNLEVVKLICKNLEENFVNRKTITRKFTHLISFVKDRPGHDKRYAIDFKKIKNDLGWYPFETFESGIKKTVLWYLKNHKFYSNELSKIIYKQERLGLKKHYIDN